MKSKHRETLSQLESAALSLQRRESFHTEFVIVYKVIRTSESEWMTTEGCGLCGDPLAGEQVGEEELEVAHFCLSSITSHLNLFDGGSSSAVVFCGECLGLIKETNRLHTLLTELSEQLEENLRRMKAKAHDLQQVKGELGDEEVVWIKEEVIHIEEEPMSDEGLEDMKDFLIIPEVSMSHDGGSGDDGGGGHRSRSSSRCSTCSSSSRSSSSSSRSILSSRSSSSRSRSSSSSSSSSSRSRGSSSSTSEHAVDLLPPSRKRRKTRKRRVRKRVPRLPKPRARKAKGGKEGKLTFTCCLCDIRFPSKDSKFFHVEKVHYPGEGEEVEGSLTLFSRICGRSSKTPRDLREHNEKLHGELLKFVCLECSPERKFVNETLLLAHQLIHREGEEFKCPLCAPAEEKEEESKFKEAVELDNHLLRVHSHLLKNHSKEKTARNAIKGVCDIQRYRPWNGAKLDPCRFCGKVVRGKSLWGLRAHERGEHPEEFKFSCGGCRGTFVEEEEMRTCEESHKEGQGTSYQCLLCKVKFKEGPLLKEHLEAKHTEGGVKCDECGIRLPIRKKVVLHKARVHGGQAPYTCGVCGVGKTGAGLLKDHMRLHHGGQEEFRDLVPEFIPCDLCDKKFVRRGAMKRHREKEHEGISGNVTCEVCGKVVSEGYLKIHRKIHLEVKDQVCHECGKAFANPAVLRSHLLVHTGEKPFGCHICGKAFNQRTPLTRHLELHKKNGTWVEKEKPRAVRNTVN